MIIDIHCGWGPTPAAPQWNDPAAVRTALGARGITSACLASQLARRYDSVAGNDAVADVTRTPDASCDLRGWLVIHPDQIEDASAQMRRYLFNDRFVGAALYPDPLTGNPVTLERTQELLIVFRRYGKALLIETPSAEAMHYAVEIAQFMGTIKVVASGMGGDEWRAAIDIAHRPSNLFLDFSGALNAEKIAFAIQQMGGVRKLVFGSGAPGTDPAGILALLDDLELSRDERSKILHANAQRAFGVGPTSAGDVSLTPMGA